MTIYNVKVPVVELVEADTPARAISILKHRLVSKGFDPYDGEPSDAFESEEP